MPKKAQELSAFQVKRLSRPGLHAVGGVNGLHLQVSPSGARSWILRVKIGNRRPDFGLGSYPDVTIEQARTRAREAREQIRQGIDPREAKRAAKQALAAANAKRMTFAEAAEKLHSIKRLEFKNKKHTAQWIQTLKTYAYPTIGKLPVEAIELSHIVNLLEPIWQTKTETATNVRQRIEATLDWATTAGYRKGENPARLSGNIEHVLPKSKKIRRRKHFPSLPRTELNAFIQDLRQVSGIPACGLEFLILTAARVSEVRFSKAKEFDLEAKIWTIPAERMKAGLQHRVPLSDRAVELLRTLPKANDEDFMFPGRHAGRALSENTFLQIVKRLHETRIKNKRSGLIDPKYGEVITVHGFRSTFTDWARTSTSYSLEVQELCLAHVNTDSTRAAYARDELLGIRQRVMRDWAQFCELPTTSNKKVVGIRSKRR